MERPSRSRRVTTSTLPSPRTERIFCSSVGPSSFVPLAFSSKMMLMPVACNALQCEVLVSGRDPRVAEQLSGLPRCGHGLRLSRHRLGIPN
jgi:hypothetical protein